MEQTEQLRQALLLYRTERNGRVDKKAKEAMLQIIKQQGECDWITLSSWLLFSGHYAHSFEDLAGRTWYGGAVKRPLSAEGYLAGVKRESADFRALYEQYKDSKDLIIIVDPPHIMTNQTGYGNKNDDYFRLKDSIKLIRILHDQLSILLSSPKSETDSLLDLYSIQTQERIEFETRIARNKIVEYTYLLNLGLQ